MTPWPTLGLRRASVNSFGYGGANAHVVLDDAFHYLRLRGISGKHYSVEIPPTLEIHANEMDETHPEPEYRTDGCKKNDKEKSSSLITSRLKLFVWTSSDEAGLNRWVTVYKDYLSQMELYESTDIDSFLRDLAYTLSSKRSMLPWKSYVVAESVKGLIYNLSANLSKPHRSSAFAPVLGFIFTGQGAQWYAMGRELFVYSVFKTSMQLADDYLRSLQCPWSLIGEMMSPAIWIQLAKFKPRATLDASKQV